MNIKIAAICLMLAILASVSIHAIKREVHCTEGQMQLKKYGISLGNSDREYYAYFPAKPVRSLPLVLVYHGGGGPLGSAEDMFHVSGWKSVAQEECIAVLFLVGTPNTLGLPVQNNREQPNYNPLVWNTGTETGAGVRNEPDVAYTVAVMRDISARIPIDSSRTFATGFSNGATFAYRAATELPASFSAVALIEAGAISASVYAEISTLRIAGVPVDLSQWPESNSLIWAKLAKCRGTTEERIGNIWARNWFGCNNDAKMREVLVGGMGHVYPGLSELFGQKNVFADNVSATKEAWKFFEDQ